MLFVGIESYTQWVFHPVDGGRAFYRRVCHCRLPRIDDEEEGCTVYGSFVMPRLKSVIFQPRLWFSKVGLDRNHYCPAFIYELISVPYCRFFSQLLQ